MRQPHIRACFFLTRAAICSGILKPLQNRRSLGLAEGLGPGRIAHSRNQRQALEKVSGAPPHRRLDGGCVVPLSEVRTYRRPGSIASFRAHQASFCVCGPLAVIRSRRSCGVNCMRDIVQPARRGGISFLQVGESPTAHHGWKRFDERMRHPVLNPLTIRIRSFHGGY